MLSTSRKTQAFSLVELSIVLVILGLLTGGILAGQSLIRAAELRSVSTEFQRYSTAIGSFRDKYFSIPGDFNSASSFGWGAYNGDANGQINMTATAGTNEISTFWIHLTSAGLVEGSYTNIPNIAFTAGTHNPRSKMNNGGWNVVGLGTVTVAGVQSYTNSSGAAFYAGYYAGSYGNALNFGNGGPLANAILPSGILKSEEAWNVDTKLDDGKPDSGAVLTFESQGSASAGSGCGNLATSTSVMAASSYDLTNTSTTACSLVFKTGY